MTYTDLIQLYFERSNALQSYWTIYVLIIGGLLAFSSLRTQPDRLTTLLISVLFCLFAYKNLGAIEDATVQRLAVRQAISQYAAAPENKQVRLLIEPTLNPPTFKAVLIFHLGSDFLTLATLWAMERRRRKLNNQSSKFLY